MGTSPKQKRKAMGKRKHKKMVKRDRHKKKR